VEFAAEGGASSALTAVSSCVSSSSSESLMTMILPSSGGPRISRLRSPKSFLVNSSSHEVSVTESSLPEDKARATTGTGSEGQPCSHRGKQRRRDEVTGGDCVDGGDPERDEGGVEAFLGEEDPSSEGERGHLRFFLSSIDLKRRARKTLSADYRCARWMATQGDDDIYSLRSVAGNSNGRRLGSLNGSVFAEKVREDEATVQRLTRVGGLIETNIAHHQPGIASGKDY
jgi:hypothetical protein